MRATLKVFLIGFRVMLRDPIMLVLIPAPFLVGVTFHFFLPIVNQFLVQQFSIAINNYYALTDGLMLLLAPTLLTISSAFLLLEECDEGISGYYQITPSGRLHYLMARIGIPALWGFINSILLGIVFTLSSLTFLSLFAISFIASLFSCAVAMMIVAFATNRVEGLAISKLTGITMIGPLIPWFIFDSWRWFLGFLPTYWLGQLTREDLFGVSFLAGVFTSFLWIALFTRKFLTKLST